MGTDGLQVHRLGARKKQPKSRSRLRRWLAVGSFCLLLGAGVAAAYSAGLLEVLFPHTSTADSMSLASPQDEVPNMAALRKELMRCKHLEFDNENGRVFESNAPCDSGVLDANGNPVPVGTMKRLNAIGKAFSGK